RQRLGFARETGDAVGVPREIPQNLDRNVSIEPGVPGAIHPAHAARADQRDDFVRTEASSGGQRHEAPGKRKYSPATTDRRKVCWTGLRSGSLRVAIVR